MTFGVSCLTFNREDGASHEDNPVTAPATVNEFIDHRATAQTAWEGDRKAKATHESGDRPCDKSTFDRVGEDAGGKIMKNQTAILAAIGASFVALPVLALPTMNPWTRLLSPARARLFQSSRSAVPSLSFRGMTLNAARRVTYRICCAPSLAFRVSHSGVAGSQTQVRVRGSEANHVLVLIDGVRANDPATGDEFRWEFLTTANIERIEIVRGPQSALWGSDAVAGVVHIITRSGGSQPRVGGYFEAGSLNSLTRRSTATLATRTGA